MPETSIPRLPPRKMTGPLVSVIMPTFRRPHVIGKAISTLLKGNWTDFELLVRDDGDGCDGTEKAVTEVTQGDSRVQYHRNEKNLGMPGNLNAGIQESRGDFIAVCHDHDLYKPSFLETMVKTLQRYPTAQFVHCAIETITQQGQFVQLQVGDWPEITPGADWLRYMLRSLNCPVCALTVVRREAHERYGLYDSSCGFISDVEMWMRLSRHGDVAYVRRPLISVRQREPNHAETLNGERWISSAAVIHRRFIPLTYGVPERPVMRLLLEARVANQYLRNHAVKLVKRMEGGWSSARKLSCL